MLKMFKKYVLPILLCSILVLTVIQPTVANLFAVSYDITVEQSAGNEEQSFKKFVEDNVSNNLLAGLTPNVVEEGTTIGVNNAATGWDVLYDGNYSTRKTLFPTGSGSGVFRYTYSLSNSITVTDLLVVCRENKTNMYALDYEIYVSDSVDELYNQNALVFSKSGTKYQAGGQHVIFGGDTKPVGRYIGFRLTNAKNKYHLGELGVYGVIVPSNVTVKQTNTNAQDVKDFIDGNLNNNVLKGLVPSVVEENTSIGVYDTATGWEKLCDGDYNTYKAIFPTGSGNGVFRYTFSLPYRLEVTDLLLVCRENNISMFALDYEIYVSETLSALYNKENKVFEKKGSDYTEGGQLITFNQDAMPIGGFIGFRLTNATNKYHLGEIGVYGNELDPLDDVKQTNTNAQEVQQFLTNNLENNVIAGQIPSVVEEGTSIDVHNPVEGWTDLYDGNYNTFKAIFPTGRGTGVLRYTYVLPYCMELTNIAVVCRENNIGTFALEYEVYASEKSEDLYNEENLIFEKTNANYTEGGQLVTFTEKNRAKCYFVGIRLVNAVNKYHLGEIGVYGNQIEDTVPYITQHTLGDLSAIQAQIKEDNLLKGIVPTLYDYMLPEMPWEMELNNSSACNWISCNGMWDLLNDGELFQTTLENKRRVDIMQGKKQGGLVLTYELKETTEIDKIVMVGMWGGFGDYCTQEYKLYISDSLDDLYDGSNLILTYNNEDRFDPQKQYSGGGQMFTFNQKYSGKYFGIRFTKENNTDQIVRLDEVGIFGRTLSETEVNILDKKLCNVYLTDGTETKLNNEIINAENRLLLTNGDLIDNVTVKSGGKNIELVYDLCKEFLIKNFSLTTAGNSRIKEYTVYAADFAEQLYNEDSKIGTYTATDSEALTATLNLDEAIKARYVRIIVSDYTENDIVLSEIAATGSSLENQKSKDIINDFDEENISAWLTDDTPLENKALLEENATFKNLVDRDKETSVKLYGAKNSETIDILFKLPNLKLINSFEYVSGSDTLPKKVSYYIGETEADVFDKDKKPSASYTFAEGDSKVQTLNCIPTVGLYVRVSVTPTEKAEDDTLAATIAQLKANGFYVEGFLDPSGDKTVLKSFTDEKVGITLKILKLYSNDIWSDIVRMEIKKRKPMIVEEDSLAGLGLKIHDAILDVCFYDSQNNRITDLGGRKLGVEFTIPEGQSVAYMAQTDGGNIWILNASYEGNKMIYTLLPEEVSFMFAMALEDAQPFEYIPDEEEETLDNQLPNDFTDDFVEDTQPEEIVEEEVEKPKWESQIGKGKLVKAVASKVVNMVHPAVWIALIAVIAVELFAAFLLVVFYILKRIKNKK